MGGRGGLAKREKRVRIEEVYEHTHAHSSVFAHSNLTAMLYRYDFRVDNRTYNLTKQCYIMHTIWTTTTTTTLTKIQIYLIQKIFYYIVFAPDRNIILLLRCWSILHRILTIHYLINLDEQCSPTVSDIFFSNEKSVN